MAKAASETSAHVTSEPSAQAEQVIIDRYAIFQTGGKQYQAIEGRTVAVEKLEGEPGVELLFPEVLLRKLGSGAVEIGQPYLDTPIKAEVVKQMKAPKVIVHKFKRRKKYSVTQGHRQLVTVVRIISL